MWRQIATPSPPLKKMTDTRLRADELTATSLQQADACAMIRGAAGNETKISDRTFGATGIAAYLRMGGTPKAVAMANHASRGTTNFMNAGGDRITLDHSVCRGQGFGTRSSKPRVGSSSLSGRANKINDLHRNWDGQDGLVRAH